MNAVATLLRDDLGAGDVPDGVAALVAAIRARFGDALQAVLMYGSCRRRGNARDGLVDLLALVDDYRHAYGGTRGAFGNALLPPNVYYLEVEDPATPGDGVLRGKYAVVSLAAFQRRCAGGLDAYFWARFSQPARAVYAAQPAVLDRIATARAAAATRFAREAAPLMAPDTLDAEAFWTRALRASYRCELRPEPVSAARALVRADAGYWQALAAALLPGLPGARDAPAGWHLEASRPRRAAARVKWGLRRAWGRTLNVARLLKAAGTFTNGIDYLVWKVERHSGVRIEPTPRMRRHPRLAAFGLAWRLWRGKALQ